MSLSKKTEESARAFWYGLINFEHRLPTPDDFKLDRMRKLLELVGNPEKQIKVVHVTGSKGKGSTCAMLASVLSSAGLKTGLYTSPHLFQVEERFRLNGVNITPNDLDAILERIQRVIGFPDCQDLGFMPTFFEVATIAAFIYFAEQNVDLAVLEVGLGGRLDSTNICNPLLSVITSISFDHERQLGPTLAHIACEKAGIIKPATTVISGVTELQPKQVIQEVASSLGSKLIQAGQDFNWVYQPGTYSFDSMVHPSVVVNTKQQSWDNLQLALLGEHQAANAALVIIIVEELRRLGFSISDDAVRFGLLNTKWQARMQVVGENPWVVVDCAHNIASALALVKTLKESFPQVPRVLLFGASSDKDIEGMFREFSGIFNYAIFAQSINSPRAEKTEELARIWSKVCSSSSFQAETLEKAAEKAFYLTPNPGILCITGSVFLAGEITPILAKLISPK